MNCTFVELRVEKLKRGAAAAAAEINKCFHTLSSGFLLRWSDCMSNQPTNHQLNS